MRIAVVGSSGAGKTMLAERLAKALGLPWIELDAINWQAGWRDLSKRDTTEFVRLVDEATTGERWVCAGNYSVVRHIVWVRATHLVWLDYERPLIMRRVLWRSLWRAIDGRELWPGTGNRETFRRWLDRDHPIRWAWDNWERRRVQFEDLIASPETAHLRIFRLRHPREVDQFVETLRREATG